MPIFWDVAEKCIRAELGDDTKGRAVVRCEGSFRKSIDIYIKLSTGGTDSIFYFETCKGIEPANVEIDQPFDLMHGITYYFKVRHMNFPCGHGEEWRDVEEDPIATVLTRGDTSSGEPVAEGKIFNFKMSSIPGVPLPGENVHITIIIEPGAK